MTLAIGLLLLLGPVVTDERPVDAPVYWPIGSQAAALSLPNGNVLVGLVDASRLTLRVYSRDGGLGPAIDLPDGVLTLSDVGLTQSASGVLVSYISSGSSSGYARVYDPVNRVFLGSRQPIGGAYNNRTYVAGQPGHLLLVHREYIDGGLRTYSQPLNDDATSAGADTDLTAYGSLSGVASNSAAHWVSFGDSQSDGGFLTTLVRVGTDGAPTSEVYLDAPYQSPVATANHVVLSRNGLSFDLAFFDSVGLLVGQASAPFFCGTPAATAFGDSVLTACGELGPGFQTTGLRMFKIEPDGGFVTQLTFPGDGGALVPAALAVGSSPVVVYLRRFTDIGRGNYRGARLLPLDDTGLLADAPPFDALLRPSSQLYPAFSSREASTPLALAWNDDRQLVREYLLEAVRLGPDGQSLEAPTELQTLNASFTNANHLHRFIADDGQAFVLPAYQAFLIEVLQWPHAAGAPTKRATVFGGILSAPLVSSVTPQGYLMTYTGLTTGSFAQYLDPQGDFSGGRFSVAGVNSSLLDVVNNGSGAYLLLYDLAAVRVLTIAGGAATELTSFAPSTFPLFGRLGRSPAMLLAAWEEAPVAGTRIVRAARVHFDGGVIDQPGLTLTLAEVVGATSLQDIGYRAGVFHVLGVTATDAGSNLWVWSIQEDGGVAPSVSTVIEAPTDVFGAAAGPPISGSRMLFAYTRATSGWGPVVQRLTLAALGDDLALGVTCTRDSECGSRVCEAQLCCIQVGACAPPDAGVPDAGAPDAGGFDGGSLDAGFADAGTDAGAVGDGGVGVIDGGAGTDGGNAVDAGALDPDAGMIGSTPGRYVVACSCDSSGGLVGLLALVTLLRRRLRSRPALN